MNKHYTLDATLWVKADTHIRAFKDFLFSVKSYDALEKPTRQLLPHKLSILSPKRPLGPSEAITNKTFLSGSCLLLLLIWQLPALSGQ